MKQTILANARENQKCNANSHFCKTFEHLNFILKTAAYHKNNQNKVIMQ